MRTCVVVALGLLGAVSAEAVVVNFPDPKLEEAVRNTIGKPTGGIYDTDLVGTGFTWLNASDGNVTDLGGLEYCTDLQELNLEFNGIKDLSPLAGLTGLWYLNLNFNLISDLSPLAGLTNLEYLRLVLNQISDISALVANSGIDAGDWVFLHDNPLSQDALCIDIPTLKERDVNVSYDGVCTGEGEGEGPFGCFCDIGG